MLHVRRGPLLSYISRGLHHPSVFATFSYCPTFVAGHSCRRRCRTHRISKLISLFTATACPLASYCWRYLVLGRRPCSWTAATATLPPASVTQHCSVGCYFSCCSGRSACCARMVTVTRPLALLGLTSFRRAWRSLELVRRPSPRPSHLFTYFYSSPSI